MFWYISFSIFWYFNVAFVEWYPGIESLYRSYVYFFTFVRFDFIDYVVWVEALSFIYYEFCFRVFEGIEFSFHNHITSSNFLFLYFVILCIIYSPNVEELSIF